MAHLSKLNHTTDALDSIKSDAIAIGLFEDGTLTSRGKSVDKTPLGAILTIYSNEQTVHIYFEFREEKTKIDI